MADIRRALVFASVGRYAARAVNLAMTVVIARMMGPKEFGVSVLGASVFLILEAIRELASVNYLVQQQDLSRAKINSAFTVSLAVTAVLTVAILLLAHPMAALYGEPRLASYLQVVTIGFTLGPFMQPMYALWSRALAFRTVAGMDVLAAITTAIASIVLVGLGFSYMGLAWGTTISGVIGVSVAFWLSRHELAIFRLSLKEWRGVVAFGIFGSATAIIYRLSDAFFFLVSGKMLDTRSVGLIQRAVTLSGFPETVILAGVNAVALPAFSHQARSGADLKEAYLSAVSHVAAVQWPALAFISAMATPLTLFVLGPRWIEVAPLAQILALALMFRFTSALNFPILVAMGAIRKTLPIAIVQVVLSQAIVIWAASMGLRAIAFSGFATAPLGLLLWMGLVRKHIPFSLGELFAALRKSFVVLLGSAIGPVAVLIYSNGAPSIPEAGVAGVLWFAGWLLAIHLTRHPLRNELGKAPGFIARRLAQKKSA
jgi:O-antigen/teichoic acid export membrane protein